MVVTPAPPPGRGFNRMNKMSTSPRKLLDFKGQIPPPARILPAIARATSAFPTQNAVELSREQPLKWIAVTERTLKRARANPRRVLGSWERRNMAKQSWRRLNPHLERDVRELVRHVAGLRDDADPNFQLCLHFAWSNFRWGRGGTGRAVRFSSSLPGVSP